MKKRNLETIIVGAIGCIVALLICLLGLWMFFQQTDTHTDTYFFAGIEMKGKKLGAVLIWAGFVTLFYTTRKTRKYLKDV